MNNQRYILLKSRITLNLLKREGDMIVLRKKNFIELILCLSPSKILIDFLFIVIFKLTRSLQYKDNLKEKNDKVFKTEFVFFCYGKIM